jgi:hypothetical protein
MATSPRKPFQFGLGSLFWLVAFVAAIGAVMDATPDPTLIMAGAASFIGVIAAAFLVDFLELHRKRNR